MMVQFSDSEFAQLKKRSGIRFSVARSRFLTNFFDYTGGNLCKIPKFAFCYCQKYVRDMICINQNLITDLYTCGSLLRACGSQCGPAGLKCVPAGFVK